MANATYDPDRLYSLLPAVYRERDEREGFPLRDLLRLVNEQADILQTDIQQLWDNFFIETCERWVIPYIGDLVSNNLLHDTHRLDTPDTARELFPDLVGPDLRPEIAIRIRADVAKTIYYRRSKGTLPMLEELARDVTGWAAHAVEFFEILGWTQHLNHLRLFRGTPDLRQVEPVDRVNGAFDGASHTVDVRRIAQSEGWYNIRNIGFFLWRLRSYPLENVRARQAVEAWQFHFSPLGNEAPLFSRWLREGDEAGLATEFLIPGPIRPAAFFASPEAFYGPELSFLIVRDGVQVPLSQVRCQDLTTFVQPTGNVVGVDVRRGRMAFGTTFVPATGVDVNYHYGFSADLGGGPYERGRWRVRRELAALHLRVRENGIAPEFPSLDDALDAWELAGRPDTIIEILDSRIYALTDPIELADDSWLAIEAANNERPHLQPNGGMIQITGDHPGSEIIFNGLLVEGGLHVTGDLRRLRLLHTTLAPGSVDPSLIADGANGVGARINAELRVQIAFSITGPIRLPEHANGLWLLDSIVDGIGGTAICATGTTDQPGPPGTLERVTIFGPSFFRKLPLASETIFTAPVISAQQQSGCVRFSFVPRFSETPRRHRCQPDLEIATAIEAAEKEAEANGTTLTAAEKDAIRAFIRGWLVPSFTAELYGLPGYAQLRLGAPVQIRTGAEDGSEMGAFCHLKQPQRETNLRIRLEEYLPFGLDAGLIYVT